MYMENKGKDVEFNTVCKIYMKKNFVQKEKMSVGVWMKFIVKLNVIFVRYIIKHS